MLCPRIIFLLLAKRKLLSLVLYVKNILIFLFKLEKNKFQILLKPFKHISDFLTLNLKKVYAFNIDKEVENMLFQSC
jgi:hypothetical protein